MNMKISIRQLRNIITEAFWPLQDTSDLVKKLNQLGFEVHYLKPSTGKEGSLERGFFRGIKFNISIPQPANFMKLLTTTPYSASQLKMGYGKDGRHFNWDPIVKPQDARLKKNFKGGNYKGGIRGKYKFLYIQSVKRMKNRIHFYGEFQMFVKEH